MKLSQETIKLIRGILNVSKLTGIERIIIDKESIRGQSEETAIITITPTTIPLEFESLGLSRLNLLANRLAIIADKDAIEVTADEKDNKVLTKLKFKSKKTSIEYRCADSSKWKIAKAVNSPIFYTFDIDDETINLLLKSNIAMEATTVTFKGEDDGRVIIRILDSSGDALEHEVSEKVVKSADCTKDTFSVTYKTKKIIQLLKDLSKGGKATVEITKSGAIIIPVNGFIVWIIPEI